MRAASSNLCSVEQECFLGTENQGVTIFFAHGCASTGRDFDFVTVESDVEGLNEMLLAVAVDVVEWISSTVAP
jgi:hypothetical protein